MATNSTIQLWEIITIARGASRVTGQVRHLFTSGGVITDARGEDHGFANEEIVGRGDDEASYQIRQSLLSQVAKESAEIGHWQATIADAKKQEAQAQKRLSELYARLEYL